MSEQETIEDILRPLAERASDSRFEALRRPCSDPFSLLHTVTLKPRLSVGCSTCGGNGWELDTSLGAIVRAAAACGLYVYLMSYDDSEPSPWCVAFDRHGSPVPSSGDTPELAAARALWAAVEGA